MEQHLNKYKGKNVLITGGAGCIGSSLTKALIKLEAAKIMVLDDLSSSEKWNVPLTPNVVFIGGTILNEEVLRRVFSEKPDFVFHLAAHFANQNSVDNPETDLMVNGLGTLKLLQYAYLAEVEKFVFASSGNFIPVSSFNEFYPTIVASEFIDRIGYIDDLCLGF